jgi:hypothetical protein
MSDEENKGLYNIHPPAVRTGGVGIAYLAAIGGLIGGFLLGWYMYSSRVGDTSNDLTCFVAMVILLIVLRYARNFYLKYESAQLELEQERVAEARALTNEQMAIINKQLEMQKFKKKMSDAPAQESKGKAKEKADKGAKHLFTSDDFDDVAQKMLAKPVKSARRAGAKVTGEGLVATFLKGVR